MCTSTNNHMIFVHTRLQKKKPKREKSGDKKLGMCIENESEPVIASVSIVVLHRSIL